MDKRIGEILDDAVYSVALTRQEADEIWARCEADETKRAKDMPTEKEALAVMFEAFQRLRELGWRDAIYCPKDGTVFQAVNEDWCTPDILNSFKEHGCAIYLKADVQALVDALAMAVQHGRIDDSETRMNLAFAALTKFKETER
jgi:hypothetical protein